MEEELTILKPITEGSVEHLFPHVDDLDTVLEAVEDENLEYIPYAFIVKLFNGGFLK